MKIFRFVSSAAFILWVIQPSYILFGILVWMSLIDIFSSGRVFTIKSVALGVLIIGLGFWCGTVCNSTATDLTQYSHLAQTLRICQLVAVGFIYMLWKNLKLANKADYSLNATRGVGKTPAITIHEGYEWATNSVKRQEVIEEVRSLLEDSDV